MPVPSLFVVATLADWYADSLRPKVRRAAARGDVSGAKIVLLERLMDDLIASERSARRVARGRAWPEDRRA